MKQRWFFFVLVSLLNFSNTFAAFNEAEDRQEALNNIRALFPPRQISDEEVGPSKSNEEMVIMALEKSELDWARLKTVTTYLRAKKEKNKALVHSLPISDNDRRIADELIAIVAEDDNANETPIDREPYWNIVGNTYCKLGVCIPAIVIGVVAFFGLIPQFTLWLMCDATKCPTEYERVDRTENCFLRPQYVNNNSTLPPVVQAEREFASPTCARDVGISFAASVAANVLWHGGILAYAGLKKGFCALRDSCQRSSGSSNSDEEFERCLKYLSEKYGTTR